jgi:hypothetical protein
MQFTPFHARPTVTCIKQSVAEAPANNLPDQTY